jgi:hypothetical protein
MGQVLSIYDWEDEVESEDENNVYYQKYRCNSCNYQTHDDDPDCSICKKKGCMYAIALDEEEEESGEEEEEEIVYNKSDGEADEESSSESYNDDLYSHNDTLVECQYCGNLWDGYAQCNCYYEEGDDM